MRSSASRRAAPSGGRILATLQGSDLFGNGGYERAARLVAAVLRILGQYYDPVHSPGPPPSPRTERVRSVAHSRNEFGDVLTTRRGIARRNQPFGRPLDPTFALAWQNLGWALDQPTQHAEAEAAFRAAIRAKPALGNNVFRREIA
jgi:hypothetical protein